LNETLQLSLEDRAGKNPEKEIQLSLIWGDSQHKWLLN